MADRKSFVLHLDYEDSFKMLTDEQLGKLTRMIFAYVKNGEILECEPIVGMAFTFIKNQLDRDNEKYLSVCERNKVNGQKGGRPKKDENPNNPSGFLENPKKPKKPDSNSNSDSDSKGNSDNKKNDISSSKKTTQQHTKTIQEIINYLNAMCGTSYKASTKNTASLIQARLNEGFTLEDFKTVIASKYQEWKGTEWEKYLRPQTLFATKFEGYLNSAPKSFKPDDRQQNKQFDEKMREVDPRIKNMTEEERAAYAKSLTAGLDDENFSFSYDSEVPRYSSGRVIPQIFRNGEWVYAAKDGDIDPTYDDNEQPPDPF